MESSLPYPSDMKLRKKYLNGLSWKNFRSKVIGNLSIESQNNKQYNFFILLYKDQINSQYLIKIYPLKNHKI